jgi:iron complex transport system permease protein
MRNNVKLIIAAVFSFLLLCIAASVGSTSISIVDTLRVIIHATNDIDPNTVSIVWKLRLPRVLLAFIVGGSISVSGAVFQSILKNQLASPYVLGVSSGASLGASLVMIGGISIPFLSGFVLPLSGFLFGVFTVFFIIAFSARLDKSLSNNTVILCGMVFSLFVNAIITLLTALFREELKTLIIWQMGSFALKGWISVRLILPFLAVGLAGIMRYAKELDMLTFGEEEAASAGVETDAVKKRLFFHSAILTGASVALSGVIGFVDLIAPHVSRKIVGSVHKYVIPMSFFVGACLMLISDLIARTIVSPSELPVGAVTAIIGAPFFAWVYFRKK